MTEDIWIYDTKKAMEKLVLWIYERIDESSDKYIRMRLSDLKKEMGKTFEDMYDAEFYWGLKPILFDLDIVTGSVILKDGTEAITMRMKTKKDVPPMTGNVWTYDIKDVNERSECFSKIPKLSDKEKEDIKKKDEKYLESLDEEEREIHLEQKTFWEGSIERRRKRIEEMIEKYGGGKIIAIRSIVVDKDFRDTTEYTNIFAAILKNGKIGIILDDGSNDDHLFCDFLRNEYELGLFFDEAHCTYIGFATNEIINGVERDIYFSNGLWSPSDDDMDIIGDELFNDRDELIHAFASVK